MAGCIQFSLLKKCKTDAQADVFDAAHRNNAIVLVLWMQRAITGDLNAM